MKHIPLFGHASSKEQVLVYAMLLASFGISLLAASKAYSFFNKFLRARYISNGRDKW
jgi:hypothetical protein